MNKEKENKEQKTKDKIDKEEIAENNDENLEDSNSRKTDTDEHKNEAEILINGKICSDVTPFVCPKNALKRAECGEVSLVEEICSKLSEKYKPQPGLGRLKIVL